MDANTASGREGSALGRMFNVLASPGEVFQEIKERPVEQANWLLPAFIWMILGGVMVLLVFSMESFQYEMKKQQEKQFERMVQSGKMTQAQADQTMANMPPWVMTIAKVFAVITTVIYAFVIPIFWGFVGWLLATQIYKADIEYMKAVEMVGLASMIYVVGTVVASLVTLAMGKLTALSPAFFIHDFDMTNRQHMMLAALNPFYLWYLIVVAVSVSVLANVPLRRPLFWCVLVWVGLRGLFLSNPYTYNFVL